MFYYLCLHIAIYIDRTYDHDRGKKSGYYKGDVLECPKLREESYKIAGMCKDCIEIRIAEERQRRRREIGL
jgi:hypothetical protein